MTVDELVDELSQLQRQGRGSQDVSLAWWDELGQNQGGYLQEVQLEENDVVLHA